MLLRELVTPPEPGTPLARVSHPGLLLGPWFPYRAGGRRPELGRAAFLRAAGDTAARGAAVAAAKRLKRLGTELTGAGHTVAAFRMTTATRLITGAGAGLPEVNATAVDPVYGLPYLPGSTIKGVARAEADRQGTPSLLEIFGGVPEADHDSGGVRFFTAVPVGTFLGARDPLLELDTATVHHKAYYEGRSGPAPTEAPNPVPLLVVPAGREFRFLLAARTPAVDQGVVTDAFELLTTALAEEGLGAATSAGYGYFDPATLARE